MFKNIIFDLGGVVVDYAPKVFLVDHFMNEKLENTLFDITFGSEEWKQLDAGLITREESEKIMREKAAAIGRKYEVDVILNDWMDMLHTKDDTVHLMRRLKKNGYRIFYLSNIPRDVLKMLSARSFFKLFDGGIASCQIKLNKPDPRAFGVLLKYYKLDPAECIFTDDNTDNVAAASALGMNAVHFKTSKQLAQSLAVSGINLAKKTANVQK
ncbi:MAG: HAD family phosphatase [Clostridia bacterium]|nr:HAD family phosphatase [Clostridia bacterium]NLS85232.1 HAD family phosphatase [Oscillospiraceae bacterium]